jgi:hypothetical protein
MDTLDALPNTWWVLLPSSWEEVAGKAGAVCHVAVDAAQVRRLGFLVWDIL